MISSWNSIDGLTLMEDPGYYLGRVSLGEAFMIYAEDDLVALLIPPAKEFSEEKKDDQTP